jgi:hypothetical protein
MPAIRQTDDEVRISAPPHANDVDPLAKQGMMRMGYRDRFER